MKFLIITALAATLVHHAGEPNADWFNSLDVPDGSLKGTSCCNDRDCRNVAVRVRENHWEVYIDSKTFPDMGGASPLEGHAPNDWVPVPEEAILHGKNNPTGEAVVCWYNRTVRCFIEGTGA